MEISYYKSEIMEEEFLMQYNQESIDQDKDNSIKDSIESVGADEENQTNNQYNGNQEPFKVMTQMESIDKRAMSCWRITATIQLIVYIAICLGIKAFLYIIGAFEDKIIIIYIVEAIILAFLVLKLIVFPVIEYRQWKYMVTADQVKVNHGLFFRTSTIIPLVRIQHITVSQGPIERNKKMFKVKIFLASGEQEIVGLTEERSNQIAIYLKEKLITRLKEERQEIQGEEVCSAREEI